VKGLEDLKKLHVCAFCEKLTARRVMSKFKIGSGVLETSNKSGYEDDSLTLGKIIDEGGIPYEAKEPLRKRNKMVIELNKYETGLKERAKKYNFDPLEE
jgi:hypothetical protein